MDPILLQQQLKNNNKDLLDFCQDLKSWGEEMQKKEPKLDSGSKRSNAVKPSNMIHKKERIDKKENLEEPKHPKRKCMSYADWEKFDADKECEKIDDSDSELTDEFDESMKEEAIVQKDKGNLFVKNGNWNEAIECYTKAIEYFAYDPVFYANRGLCYLKKNEMDKVVQDCTISLKLDNSYVKAYQRRAAAWESLNKLEDAKLDLLRVLQLEPKNIESKNNLQKLNEKIKSAKTTEETNETNRPISKFTASRQLKKDVTAKDTIGQEFFKDPEKKKIDIEKPTTFWPSGDKVPLVKAIKKPPHLRSKKPLKRIEVLEINSAKPQSTVMNQNVSSWPKSDGVLKTIKSDEFKVIEHKLHVDNEKEMNNCPQNEENNRKKIICSPEIKKDVKNIDNFNVCFKQREQSFPTIEQAEVLELVPPKTSVQFHSTWKRLKDLNEKKCEYLKMLNPHNIPELFKESLESQIFSEILFILSNYLVADNDRVYEYLLHLTKIKRFTALCMFLTLNDKNCLWKMFNRIKESKGNSKEVDELIKEYEL